MLRRILAVTAVVLVAAAAIAGESSLPKDFRSWAHVKSMVITDKGHGLYGFHNVYANPAALKAMRAGAPYQGGSEFVVSFYEVAADGPMLSTGKKIMDTYMRKDAAAKQTGGWAFGVFGPDGKPLGLDVVKGCYECHAGGAKGTDLVFSKFVE